MIKFILLQNFCYVFRFPPSYQTKFSHVKLVNTVTASNPNRKQMKSLKATLTQFETVQSQMETISPVWAAKNLIFPSEFPTDLEVV